MQIASHQGKWTTCEWPGDDKHNGTFIWSKTIYVGGRGSELEIQQSVGWRWKWWLACLVLDCGECNWGDVDRFPQHSGQKSPSLPDKNLNSQNQTRTSLNLGMLHHITIVLLTYGICSFVCYLRCVHCPELHWWRCSNLEQLFWHWDLDWVNIEKVAVECNGAWLVT